jgi:predicted ribosomally synthesized peptide with SipW-like signal peptide
MTTTIAADAADRQDERKRKRGAVIKFSLAGAALLGIAAAATSAAWTDNAWFSATARAATVELKGAVSDTNADIDASDAAWVRADAQGDLVVDSAVFGDLLPGDTKTVYLHILNAGSTNLNITNPTYTVSNPTFFNTTGATDDEASVVLATVPTSLAKDAQAAIALTVTTDADWVEAAQGQSTDIVVQLQGTATH